MPCSAWTKTPLFSMYPLCFVHDDSQTENFFLYNPQSDYRCPVILDGRSWYCTRVTSTCAESA